MDRNPARDVRIILGMLLVVAIPVLLTHSTIRVPVTEMHTVADPTPKGYTMSLLLFLVPVLAIGVWHMRYGHEFDKKAFIWCAGLMTCLGAFLDIFFGYSFFRFPNEGATLGIRIPAWSWADRAWIPDFLPLEEFGFYIFGALFMVAVYLWADLNWLQCYDPDRYADLEDEAKKPHIEISPHAAAVWVTLVGGGILYRWLSDGGFPGYYVFLMGAGVLPSLFLVRMVKPYVNWQALAFAFGGLVLISIIWEATMGLPYEWWTYQSDQMLGIYLPAWGNLPLEEVSLWLVGTWDAVMFYELFRIIFRSDQKVREAFIRTKSA